MDLRDGKIPVIASAEIKGVGIGDTLRAYEDDGLEMPERTGRWVMFEVTYVILWEGSGVSLYICAVGKPVAFTHDVPRETSKTLKGKPDGNPETKTE